jgi:hypothetical protein
MLKTIRAYFASSAIDEARQKLIDEHAQPAYVSAFASRIVEELELKAAYEWRTASYGWSEQEIKESYDYSTILKYIATTYSDTLSIERHNLDELLAIIDAIGKEAGKDGFSRLSIKSACNYMTSIIYRDPNLTGCAPG